MVFDFILVASVAGKDATAAGETQPAEALFVVLTRARQRQRMAFANARCRGGLLRHSVAEGEGGRYDEEKKRDREKEEVRRAQF